MAPAPLRGSSDCVLVVDPAEETQEVLRFALESRGLRILQARAAAQAVDLAREHRPDVIVLDLEIETDELQADGGPPQWSETIRAQAGAAETHVILLGTLRQARRSGEELMAKPYHYAPLIQRIEAILESRS